MGRSATFTGVTALLFVLAFASSASAHRGLLQTGTKASTPTTTNTVTAASSTAIDVSLGLPVINERLDSIEASLARLNGGTLPTLQNPITADTLMIGGKTLAETISGLNARIASIQTSLAALASKTDLSTGLANAIATANENANSALTAAKAALEARMRAAEERLTGAEGRLTGAEGRLNGAEGRLHSAEGRLDGAETRLSGAEGRLTGAENRLHGAEGRLDTAESGLDVLVKVDLPAAQGRLRALELEQGNIVNVVIPQAAAGAVAAATAASNSHADAALGQAQTSNNGRLTALEAQQQKMKDEVLPAVQGAVSTLAADLPTQAAQAAADAMAHADRIVREAQTSNNGRLAALEAQSKKMQDEVVPGLTQSLTTLQSAQVELAETTLPEAAAQALAQANAHADAAIKVLTDNVIPTAAAGASADALAKAKAHVTGVVSDLTTNTIAPISAAVSDLKTKDLPAAAEGAAAAAKAHADAAIQQLKTQDIPQAAAGTLAAAKEHASGLAKDIKDVAIPAAADAAVTRATGNAATAAAAAINSRVSPLEGRLSTMEDTTVPAVSAAVNKLNTDTLPAISNAVAAAQATANGNAQKLTTLETVSLVNINAAVAANTDAIRVNSANIATNVRDIGSNTNKIATLENTALPTVNSAISGLSTRVTTVEQRLPAGASKP
ncbi:hypothetical protein HYH02_003503 [Chlamydomonas schloesseri]|uniref:Uncharacterized protein n=1 Tax=Chlamydomonas schloesseri TaxID=2026947 RepID=A0A835WPL8_9CHLO|nr:hypothetical protein HYH02_003503 [Chlamydomonas schloesseri]|eukprot:KAG2451723.1 hypothetical protein HYH02_003503 [Chlamydomonas schloesseri]